MLKYISIFFISLISVTAIHAQTEIKAAVEKQELVFVAETVIPNSGSTRFLTSEYDFIITKEKVIAFLPYFGRANSAPIDPSEAGIKFTSTDFIYKMLPRKKGGWDILIKPNGVRAASSVNLTIFENGRATMHVRGAHRDLITFHGYIKAYTAPDKKEE